MNGRIQVIEENPGHKSAKKERQRETCATGKRLKICRRSSVIGLKQPLKEPRDSPFTAWVTQGRGGLHGLAGGGSAWSSSLCFSLERVVPKSVSATSVILATALSEK